jgi:hypothetical protein
VLNFDPYKWLAENAPDAASCENSISSVATATPATLATNSPQTVQTVAVVATVAGVRAENENSQPSEGSQPGVQPKALAPWRREPVRYDYSGWDKRDGSVAKIGGSQR